MRFLRKLLSTIFIVLLVASLAWLIYEETRPILVSKKTISEAPFYEGSGSLRPAVSVFDEDVSQVTQIEITPDGKYMFVGTLPGTVWVYQKVDGEFVRQIEPFVKIETSQPGFPPREAGLTGLVLGADFAKSGDIFLNYSFAAGKKEFKNRVTRVEFSTNKKLFSSGRTILGKNPALIFESNTPGAPSHQIQDGVGVMVAGKPHLLFPIGEGFKGVRALNPKLEAGKLILIQRDGASPVGERPFTENPKVQAIGIRNAMPITHSKKFGKIALADTGPNHFDRFMYGTMIEKDGKNTKPQSFNWNGQEASLATPVIDMYKQASPDMVLYRWDPTETAVGISFYANEKLPSLLENQEYVLIELFGKTNFKSNKPGKKIVLGVITNTPYGDSLTFEDLVVRKAEGEGKLSHPLGLGIDPTNKVIYFGDIMEGRIYKAEMGGDTK